MKKRLIYTKSVVQSFPETFLDQKRKKLEDNIAWRGENGQIVKAPAAIRSPENDIDAGRKVDFYKVEN